TNPIGYPLRLHRRQRGRSRPAGQPGQMRRPLLLPWHLNRGGRAEPCHEISELRPFFLEAFRASSPAQSSVFVQSSAARLAEAGLSEEEESPAAAVVVVAGA